MKKLTSEEIDKFITKNFEQKLMNNSKWKKVCETLLNQDEVKIIRFKLIHDSELRESTVHCIESELHFNWFIEPRVYKEIEWLEVQKFYKQEIYKNYFETKEQNIEELYHALQKLGQLPIEFSEKKIKLTAYK